MDQSADYLILDCSIAQEVCFTMHSPLRVGKRLIKLNKQYFYDGAGYVLELNCRALVCSLLWCGTVVTIQIYQCGFCGSCLLLSFVIYYDIASCRPCCLWTASFALSLCTVLTRSVLCGLHYPLGSMLTALPARFYVDCIARLVLCGLHYPLGSMLTALPARFYVDCIARLVLCGLHCPLGSMLTALPDRFYVDCITRSVLCGLHYPLGSMLTALPARFYVDCISRSVLC